MAKPKPTFIETPVGTFALAYINKPDDQAPEGAAWKPDGKYKITTVYDDQDALEDLRATCVKVIRAEYPEAPEDEDQLALPIRLGEQMGGKKAEAFAGKVTVEAKSQYQPKVYDAAGALAPEGVWPFGGDQGRFGATVFPFKKTEKVREGKRMVDVDIYGASLRLAWVQISEKRARDGDGGGPGAIEGGFKGGRDDNAPGPTKREPRRTADGAGSGDF